MERKKNTILLVTGILLIIGGAIGLVGSIIAVLGARVAAVILQIRKESASWSLQLCFC